MMSDCIFCKIAAKEIPSNKVYEDDMVLAFKDLEPQGPVHVLAFLKSTLEVFWSSAMMTGSLWRILPATLSLSWQRSLE